MNTDFSSSEFWKNELLGAKLPDLRFFPNLVRMCESLERKPGHSFSASCGEAVRKSAHRLFSKTQDIDIQQGHRNNTLIRSLHEKMVLVLEDTTDLSYTSHKEKSGMGRLGGPDPYGTWGVQMHSAMALTTLGEPLGLVGQHIWSPKTNWKTKRVGKYPIEEKESYKWIKTKKWVDELYGGQQIKVLVVGDREADFYEHISYARRDNVDLLVRGCHLYRNIIYKGNKLKIQDLPSRLKKLGEKEIEVGRKKGVASRKTKLSIRKCEFIYPPSSEKKGCRVTLNLVHVKEPKKRGLEKPIEWYLLTTLEVSTLENAWKMVEYYSYRWIIERFHYVLKSGMRVEKLQFDTFERLKNALEVCSMVAWKTLWTAYIAKVKPEDNAADYFEETEIIILGKLNGKKIKTNRDFILALGSLSGFVKSKAQPLPGEKLLWQSIKLLNAMKIGFNLSNNSS